MVLFIIIFLLSSPFKSFLKCNLIKSNFENIAFSGQTFIRKAVEQTAITNLRRTFDNVENLNHLTKTTSLTNLVTLHHLCWQSTNLHPISEKTQVCYYGRMVKEPLPFSKFVKFSFIETKILPPHISPFLKIKNDWRYSL